MNLLKHWRRWRRSRFHPTDYRRVVDELIERHGLAKAVDLAVGGGGALGELELIILDHFGLRDGHYLVDVGCGSGRLTRLAARLPRLRYLGTDISKRLLHHARVTCAREDFRFELVHQLVIPEADSAADFVCFFSVGTHLMHEQFFVYLREAHRVLRPRGRILLSFLDLKTPAARRTFDVMVAQAQAGVAPAPINVFCTVDTVRIWAQMLGLDCIEFVDGNEKRFAPSERMAAVVDGGMKARALGQSLAVLEKPDAMATEPR